MQVEFWMNDENHRSIRNTGTVVKANTHTVWVNIGSKIKRHKSKHHVVVISSATNAAV